MTIDCSNLLEKKSENETNYFAKFPTVVLVLRVAKLETPPQTHDFFWFPHNTHTFPPLSVHEILFAQYFKRNSAG